MKKKIVLQPRAYKTTISRMRATYAGASDLTKMLRREQLQNVTSEATYLVSLNLEALKMNEKDNHKLKKEAASGTANTRNRRDNKTRSGLCPTVETETTQIL